MSYNTSEIRFLSGTLFISADKLKEFEEEQDFSVGSEMRLRDVDNGLKQILRIPSGECTLNHLLPEFLAMTEGEADILVVWEGGDSIGGLRVKNGAVEEMDVEYVLLPKAKP